MGDIILQPIRKMPMHLLKMKFSAHSNIHSGDIQGLPQKILNIQSTFIKSWFPFSIRKWVSNLIKFMYQDKQSQFCRLSLEFDKKFDKYSHDLDTCLLIKIVLYYTAVCCIQIFYQCLGLLKKDLKSNFYGKFWV